MSTSDFVVEVYEDVEGDGVKLWERAAVFKTLDIAQEYINLSDWADTPIRILQVVEQRGVAS